MSYKKINIVVFLTLIQFSVMANVKNPLILLSIDGFSNTYLEKYQPPNLLSLAKNGVRAQALTPVYPSKTFPNHLSIVTGVYPAKHGIVHNRFYRPDLNKSYYLGAGKDDSSWLTAQPIWTVAELQGLRTAVYFWPESEATISETLPTYYYPYQHNTPNITRVNQLINWLKLPSEERPQLLISYFSTVDSAGHEHGPNSKQVALAVKEVDQLIGLLVSRINNEINQDVNIVIVSDHGMVPLTKSPIKIASLLEEDDKLTVVNGQTQLLIYSDSDALIKNAHSQLSANNGLDKKFKVYRKKHFPQSWHLTGDSPAIPDLIVEAIQPFYFTSSKRRTVASHGFDPLNDKELAAIFIAAGPDFIAPQTINAFENIHIYPLLAKLLGIKPNSQIDGNIKVLESIINTNNH